MQSSPEKSVRLWEPSATIKQQANITHYRQWLTREKGLSFGSYEELWEWSVNHLEDFWASLWDYFDIQASQPYSTVLGVRTMPGAQWFPGAELNYAEHVFRHATSSRPALLFQAERQPLTEVSWQELRHQVGLLANMLRAQGVQRGDRIVSCMPNIPETLIAFLATASLGAIWSSCSPDFGTQSVIDRFKQIEPKVLIAVDGYQYNGKPLDRRSHVAELQQHLPSLQHTVLVPYLHKETDTEGLTNTTLWQDALQWQESAELTFEQVPFDQPLWILYSSGTTGIPKAIVQSQGGILLEHLKTLHLGMDLKPDDRFFWYTTTGWMMWNMLIGGLLLGTTILLYDGNPAYPDMRVLWKLAEESGMTFFGTSAGYITACMKAGLEPGQTYDLSRLRALGSTGSPLPAEGFQWVYEHVKKDIWLVSTSGGTDVCAPLISGSIILPVYIGELQCRPLGVKAEAFDDNGKPLIDEVGELVITEPMPSMPLFFWHDRDERRYRESYFDMYPGVWRHGDWMKLTSRGSAIIYGRSDATLNKQGIRIGSSDIYSVIEALPEILNSLVVGVEQPDGGYYMPLFVVLREGVQLDDTLKARIKQTLRAKASPHHVPDEIIAIQEVPLTLTGKKTEVPVKKLFMGVPVEQAVSMDALGNPQAMQYFIAFAQEKHASRETKHT
jgi:acetoacetyl-CoA synthetase